MMIVRVENKNDILAVFRQHGASIKALGVERLALFGSFVRGENRADSDVDVVVDFRPDEKNIDRFIAVAELLEGLLGRPVHLVTRESLSPYIGPKILMETENVPLGA